MARKRESRNKQPNRKETDQRKLASNDDNFVTFCNQLAILGLTLREIPGDG